MKAALIVALLFLFETVFSQNPNCKILVPPNPLTATGLATPYQLSALNVSFGPCNMANPAQSAFVQGVIFDTATNQFSVYNPLVIDAGTQPLVTPTAPNIPATGVVGLWFGFNGNILMLTDAANGATLKGANCVNGLAANDLFGEYAYCNAVNFFTAVNAAINNIVIPPLGVGKDGNICPTTRDFSVVDMDPNDNVVTQYLNVGNQVAQSTAANMAMLQQKGAQVTLLANPSDERLVDLLIDRALGCKPWMVPDLADNNNLVAALPLNEIFAAKWQTFTPALVPAGDPMVLSKGAPNLQKLNLYRAGVNQPAAATLADGNTTLFCINFLAIAPQRLLQDRGFTTTLGSPNPAANSLFTFLAMRLNQAIGADVGLNCLGLLKIASNPIVLVTDANGVFIDANVNFAVLAAAGINPATLPANTLPPANPVTSANVMKAPASVLSVQLLLLTFALFLVLF